MSNKVKVKKRRDRNTLTFYEKIAVIRHHEANQLSRNNLARMFQCCTTQIRKIIERKDEILAQWQAMCDTNASAVIEEMSKKRREFEMKAVGFILHQWIERCRELQLNMVINDATLKMVAIKLATVLNITNFKPTGRWIERFRLKFKYKNANLSNPRSLDDPEGTLSVEDIIIEFKNFLPSFMRQEISNITSNDIGECVPAVAASTTANSSESEILENTNENQCNVHSEQEGEEENRNTREHDEEGILCESISVENVLQHLSVIQQFLLSNSDYQAIRIAAHLENYIEQKYIDASQLALPIQQTDSVSEDDEFIVLIE